VPPDWLLAVAGLVVSSGWMVTRDEVQNGWLDAAALLAIGIVATAALVHFSRRSGWTQKHTLAVAGGTLLTYAWHAFPETPVFDASHTVDLIGNAVFALLAVALLISATLRCDKFGDS
jgi:peptidoglycan/LPS O-acetylase OafA/YrhL